MKGDPKLEIPPSLTYVSDEEPGITRRAAGKGFAFYQPDGQLIRDKATRERLLGLAVPPAYHDVWYSPKPEGHLQATGFDDRNRKQYRYHPRWSEWREQLKFDSLIEFGEALPKLRGAIGYQLSGSGFEKERVLAAVVRLLDKTAARIGNQTYLEENGTSGLSTLTQSDAEVENGHLLLSYTAKGGEHREFDLYQPVLAEIVSRLQDLPGQHLFCYQNGGRWHPIDSADVNQWLKEKTELDISAKDFRTWRASVLTLDSLVTCPPAQTKKEIIAQQKDALRKTSVELGHRPPVCRKHYVHPRILEEHRAHTLSVENIDSIKGLSASESQFLSFLKS